VLDKKHKCYQNVNILSGQEIPLKGNLSQWLGTSFVPHGGLNLRSIKTINKASILKLSWELIANNY